VDASGATTLTVLSGAVEFSNTFGALVVEKNEQALAEVGRAPTKLLIANPRDRVQWVTSYAVEPQHHITASSGSPAEIAALEQVAAAIQAQRFPAALTQLDALVSANTVSQPAPYLLLADVML